MKAFFPNDGTVTAVDPNITAKEFFLRLVAQVKPKTLTEQDRLNILSKEN
jgi:hypothetical protein